MRGRRYRSPIGLIQLDAVALVDDGDITESDARSAGYTSVGELLADLRGPADAAIYRLELHRTTDADPREQLASNGTLSEAELRQLQARLARLDLDRPWTAATLQAIQEHPGTRAGDLAALLGWPDRLLFKAHVRKLKALGLTCSLRVGYRLSPRGEAYLRTAPVVS